MINKSNLPKHIAIIMDGNGRWARKRKLPRVMGHRAGVKAVKEVVEASRQLGIEVLTLYAFSTENWNRPKEEVNTLMKLLGEYLKNQTGELNKNNIRLTAIGDIIGLPNFVQERLKKAMYATRNNSQMILNLALNYGSRKEIIDAVKKIVSEIKKEKFKLDSLNEEIFSRYLYTAELPDPDLLIRTSGELRVSNFLLWQISYTEIYITPKLWPDFKKKDLENAIEDFQLRERRFGGHGAI